MNTEAGLEVNVEIAHILAHSPNGPRFDSSVDPSELRDFKNLILVCKPHHKMIDKKRNLETYTVDVLRQWKRDREGDFEAEIEGLDNLTQDKLEGLLVDAVESVKADLDDAVVKLESVNKEAADKVRVLLSEVFDRPYLDIDTVTMLNESAHMLANLQDSSSILLEAASRLHGLQDSAGMLSNAAHHLSGLQDSANMLSNVASSMGNVQDGAALLMSAAADIKAAGESIPEPWRLAEVADRLEAVDRSVDHSAREIDVKLQNVVTDIRNYDIPESISVEPGSVPGKWDYFFRGVVTGLVLTVLAAILIIMLQAGNS